MKRKNLRLWSKRLEKRQIARLNFLFGGLVIASGVCLIALNYGVIPLAFASALIYAVELQLIGTLIARYTRQLAERNLQTVQATVLADNGQAPSKGLAK